jgi:hypothetical protein
MTERDSELNELLAKRLLADVAANIALQNHLEGPRTIAGVYHGAGGQLGASGYYQPKA